MIEEITNNLELPITPKKPSNPFLNEASERREQIMNLICKIGFYNIDQKILAMKFKVSDRTIRKDLFWIKGHWKPKNLRDLKIQTTIAIDRALNQALLLLAENPPPEIKIRAIQTLLQAAKAYREELEEWGDKPKIADRQENEIKGYKFELIQYPNTKEGYTDEETGRITPPIKPLQETKGSKEEKEENEALKQKPPVKGYLSF